MTQTDLEGRTVLDSEGNKIGKIGTVYIDPDTQRPQWGLVHTGFFGGRQSFVPLVEMQPEGDDLRVPYSKQQVTDAPNIEPEGEISVEEEATLARHYGLGYSTEESPTGVIEPRGGQAPGANRTKGEETMTRSEEQMKVGVMSRPSELVRLRKTVVTEPVAETVPLQREELRVERQPIGEHDIDAAGTPEISEATHEVTLSEEEPVVEKTTVPVEQVSLGKDVVTEEREVTGEVRKERVEVERETQR